MIMLNLRKFIFINDTKKKKFIFNKKFIILFFLNHDLT